MAKIIAVVPHEVAQFIADDGYSMTMKKLKQEDGVFIQSEFFDPAGNKLDVGEDNEVKIDTVFSKPTHMFFLACQQTTDRVSDLPETSFDVPVGTFDQFAA